MPGTLTTATLLSPSRKSPSNTAHRTPTHGTRVRLRSKLPDDRRRRRKHETGTHLLLGDEGGVSYTPCCSPFLCLDTGERRRETGVLLNCSIIPSALTLGREVFRLIMKPATGALASSSFFTSRPRDLEPKQQKSGTTSNQLLLGTAVWGHPRLLGDLRITHPYNSLIFTDLPREREP